jgi:Fe-S cluster biogenesis protein NfuA
MSDYTAPIERIIQVLHDLQPMLESHGGWATVHSWNAQTGIVTISMGGACGSCPMSMMTLKGGIEARMKEEIPEVNSVESL